MRRDSNATPRPRRASARGLPAWLRWAVQVVRFLVLACALQLSGGAHLVIGIVAGANVGCIDVCNDGPDDHDCPPGCPDCACPHGRLPSLPPSIHPSLPELLAWEIQDEATPYRAGVPPSPPLRALDRPPRA